LPTATLATALQAAAGPQATRMSTRDQTVASPAGSRAEASGPGAAAHDAPGAAVLRPSRISDVLVAIIPQAVGAPLPDIAVHVLQGREMPELEHDEQRGLAHAGIAEDEEAALAVLAQVGALEETVEVAERRFTRDIQAGAIELVRGVEVLEIGHDVALVEGLHPLSELGFHRPQLLRA